MLYITIREWDNNPPEDLVWDIQSYFRTYKKKEWFNDPFVKEIIKEIDNSIAVKDEYIESPVFGGMSPENLSSGTKCLILLWCIPNIHIYGTRMGDNCVPKLLEIGEKKDIHITLGHLMEFGEWTEFRAIVTNSGREIRNAGDFIDEWFDIEFRDRGGWERENIYE